jgi:hypothetical protein
MLSTNSGTFEVKLIDAGLVYPGVGVAGTTSRIDCYVANAGGLYVQVLAPTSTVPFTWATTDQIVLSGTYESA